MKSVRTKWDSLVAVCDECSGGKRMRKELRRAAKDGKLRGVRIVRSSCLDVCPKKGVTVAFASARGAHTIVIDDVDEAFGALAGPRP